MNLRALCATALCATVLALPVLPQATFAQPVAAPQATRELPEKKPSRLEAAGQARLHWYDGGKRHALLVDPARVADFSEKSARARVPLRPASQAEKGSASLPAGVSPVFRDADAPGRLRALPGGVIVTLKVPPAGNDAGAREAQARRELVAAGLEPLRAIDPEARRWLVASPAGLPALELANRLQESGDFESAAPNWWRQRTLK